MADKLIKIDLITPQKVIYSGDAVSVSVPGSKSPFQILFNHAPIVSALDNGKIKIVDSNNKEHSYKTGTGFAELQNNILSILVEEAEEI